MRTPDWKGYLRVRKGDTHDVYFACIGCKENCREVRTDKTEGTLPNKCPKDKYLVNGDPLKDIPKTNV